MFGSGKRVSAHMASCCMSWGIRCFFLLLRTRGPGFFKVHFFCGLIALGMYRVLPCIALYCTCLCSFGGGVDGKRDLQLRMQQ